MTGSPLLKGWVLSISLHSVVIAGAMWSVTERYSQSPEQAFRMDVTLVEDSGPGEVQAPVQVEADTEGEAAPESRLKSPSPPQESQKSVEQPVAEAAVPPRNVSRVLAPVAPPVENAMRIRERVVGRERAQGVIKPVDSVKATGMPLVTAVAEEEASLVSTAGVNTQVASILSQPSSAARSLDAVTQETASDVSVRGDEMVPPPIPREEGAQPMPSNSVLAAPSTKTDVRKTDVRKPDFRKSDLRWLANTMHRRITERKRYPRAARDHHWEGKVVLRAVIGQDGHLAELSLQRSSGYDLLDQEAMDLVRQVCPLPLERTLGRPRVVMYVPITYALEN